MQAPILADSATASRRVKMGWSFYSHEPNGDIWNAITNLSTVSKNFENATVDELYRLTNDEDQSEDLRNSNKQRLDVLKRELTNFLNKNATHSGQLPTPEKATKWKAIVTRE